MGIPLIPSGTHGNSRGFHSECIVYISPAFLYLNIYLIYHLFI
jgi:hypothetical protein